MKQHEERLQEIMRKKEAKSKAQGKDEDEEELANPWAASDDSEEEEDVRMIAGDAVDDDSFTLGSVEPVREEEKPIITEEDKEIEREIMAECTKEARERKSIPI